MCVRERGTVVEVPKTRIQDVSEGLSKRLPPLWRCQAQFGWPWAQVVWMCGCVYVVMRRGREGRQVGARVPGLAWLRALLLGNAWSVVYLYQCVPYLRCRYM